MPGRVACSGGGDAPPRRSALVGAGQAAGVGAPATTAPFKPKKQRPAKLRILVQRTNRAREFGDPDTLRVIFCPFSDSGDAFGVTDGGTSSALTVPRFCLINAQAPR